MKNTMKELKGLCAECPKRDRCKELCAAAEAYASQDYVSQSDQVTRNNNAFDIAVDIHGNVLDEPQIPASKWERREKYLDEIRLLLKKGLSQRYIAKKLKIPQQTISDWLTETTHK